MSDYVKQQIEERRRRLEDLHRQTIQVEAELRAYEDVLGHAGGNAVSNTGKVNGSASPFVSSSEPHWPAMIEKLGKDGARFSIDQIEQEMLREGKVIKRKSIRAKLSMLTQKGRIRRVKEGVYRVNEQHRETGEAA